MELGMKDSLPSFLLVRTMFFHAPPERGRAARPRASREALSFFHILKKQSAKKNTQKPKKKSLIAKSNSKKSSILG